MNCDILKRLGTQHNSKEHNYLMQNNTLALPLGKKYLTHSEAAGVLKATRSGILSLVRRGLLKPIPVEKAPGYQRASQPGRKPVFVFAGQDVARLADKSPFRQASSRHLASEAFAAFERGETITQVVISLQLTPERASEIYEAWLRVTGGIYVPRVVVDKLRQLGFKTTDASSLVERMENLLDEVRAARRR